MEGERRDLKDVLDLAKDYGWDIPEEDLPPEAKVLYFYNGDFYHSEVTYSKFHDPQSKDVYWYMISGEDKKKIEIEDTDDIAEVLHFLKQKGVDDE